VLDLCVPRNVAPDVHDVPGVRLVDLSELRVVAAEASDALTADVAAAEAIVAEQLDRYLRWLAGRSAARSVQRLRTDLEVCAREELDRVSPDLPQDVRALMEESLRRTVRRLAHGPTRRLLEAAEAGDADLVETLAGLFATIPAGTEHATESVS